MTDISTRPSPAPGSPAPGSPPGLAVSPVPTQFEVTPQVMPNGQVHLLLACRTPLGVQVYFLPGETAKELGELLLSHGGAARSGLFVAGQTPPDAPPAA